MRNKIIRYGVTAAYVLILAGSQWYCCFYTMQSRYLWVSVFAELFAILSSLGLADGAAEVIRYCRIKREGIAKNAIIKGYHVRTYRKGKWYYPILSFQSREHITYRVQSADCFSFMWRRYRVGKKLRIAYLPDDPYAPVIIPLTLYNRLGAAVFFGSVTVIFAVISVAMLFP